MHAFPLSAVNTWVIVHGRGLCGCCLRTSGSSSTCGSTSDTITTADQLNAPVVNLNSGGQVNNQCNKELPQQNHYSMGRVYPYSKLGRTALSAV